MARLWESGFETGTTEWNGGNSGAGTTVSVQSTTKRSGTYALILSSSTFLAFFRQILAENQIALYGRLAVQLDSNASARDQFTLISFRDSNNATQFNLVYDGGTGTFEWRNEAGSTLGAGNIVIPASTWMVLEFEVLVSGSGTLTLKVNGSTSSVYSGNTDLTGAGNIRSLYFLFSGGGTSGSIYLDDIAINNTDGVYQNSWIGLGGVYWLYPTADGYQNDWTPSAGLDNYALVDERPPNTTDYVQALDAADLDLYELLDTPEYVARINLLRVMYRAAVTTAGSNDLRDVIRVDSVNHEGDTFTVVPLIPSFTLYTGPAYYLNPETAAAWEVAEVDALEAGFEIV